MIRRVLAIPLTLSLIIISAGCTASGEKHFKKTFYAMSTVMDITLYGVTSERSEELFSLCQAEIIRQENLFSVNIQASEISMINSSDGKTAKVSEETASLINKSLSASGLTGGAFDISVYPIVRLWGFSSGEFRVPSKDEIDSSLKYVGYEDIVVNDSSVTHINGAGVDLGGIAKGYLGDCLADILVQNGVSSAVLSLGGNIVLVGTKNDGNPWSVAVRSPFSSSDYICQLSLSGGVSVVTSGAYERSFSENGVTYHHIIDPKTGYPADSDLASVTVIGSDGALCDAFSTALFVMGKEKALAFLEKHEELSYVLVTADGEKLMSDSLSTVN